MTLEECILFVDGEEVNKSENINNNQPNSLGYKFSCGDEGKHTWYIKCLDSSGQWNESGRQEILIDDMYPKISPIPINNSGNHLNFPINFSYVPEDDCGLRECILFVDGEDVNKSETVKNNQPNSLEYGFSCGDEGVHTWFVRCIDSSNKANNSEIEYIFLSQTAHPAASCGACNAPVTSTSNSNKFICL